MKAHNLLVSAAAVFLGAFLLFQIQPIIARYILPWFGGGPAVWTACMLFFQAALLLGYLYAHWLKWPRVHGVLLAGSLALLPITPRAEIWKPLSSTEPNFRILLLLAATVGAPYFLLSATAPLAQRWLVAEAPGQSPWRLYALSNFASFLALLSYPFAVEPFVRLRTQAWAWSALYVLFVLVCGVTAWRAAAPRVEKATSDDAPRLRDILFWIGLAASASTILLATTNQISQEIAVNPFLWIAPLSIYLLTFVLTFESPRWYRRGVFAPLAGVLAAIACAVLSAAVALSLWSQIGIYLAALFATCMVCHGELARSRPPASHLTGFYLAIAGGGAAGGVFVALIAPRVFNQYSELHIGLAAACLLGLLGWLRGGGMALWTSRNFAVRVPVMALLLGGLTAVAAAVIGTDSGDVQVRRNFYGILRLSDLRDDNGPLRKLNHGSITHGFQYLDEPKRDWPTTYYGPHSGVGLALAALNAPARSIGVVGLGAGTLAAWGHPGDRFRFYEINPDVGEIANTSFTFLKDSKASIELVLGDGRVQLERELAQGRAHDFDLIAVDAFSSDAIPLHLLTTECADIYKQRLMPGGLLLLHISNRRLNLEPVARGMAQHLGWKSVYIVSPADSRTGESQAHWVVMSSDSDLLEKSAIAGNAVSWLGPARPPLAWTDDFASLWHVLK
ncbi:MAG: fused MFS/spermidine synthase [Bryobacterales bacterium]|nr:fused MFS/spermidine synthase [Bryobacterales bacterium]